MGKGKGGIRTYYHQVYPGVPILCVDIMRHSRALYLLKVVGLRLMAFSTF